MSDTQKPTLDNARIERALRAAEHALASGDPDTLAGRFNPKPLQPQDSQSPTRKAARG